MPMFKALQACPNATVINPDMNKYAAVGRKVRDDGWRNLNPSSGNRFSIDEAFMDLAGTEALHRAIPAATLAALARRVEEAAFYHCFHWAQLQQVPRQDRLGLG